MNLLLNIDVPDLAAAERFYTEAFGLRRGRPGKRRWHSGPTSSPPEMDWTSWRTRLQEVR